MYNICTLKSKYSDWDMDIKIAIKYWRYVGDTCMQMFDEE